MSTDFAHKNILVLGAGVTGTSVARFLQSRGAQITLTDDNSEGAVKPSEVNLKDFEAVVISPGWRQDHPLVAQILSSPIEMLNEIDIAWSLRAERAPGQKWIALTGTNGKTTTVEMTAAILQAAGIKAVACGNVGDTVIDAVDRDDAYDVLVLELSSFQLHWAKQAQFEAAAILNIADDHLDWHGSFDAYADAKFSILDRTDTAILNADDGPVVVRANRFLGRKVFFSLNTPAPGEIGVVEELLVDRAFVADPQQAAMICELVDIIPTVPHNVSNALAAAGLARALDVPHEDIQKALRDFRPGRHRIETVHENNGVTWINDSKATNPHAANASLAAFSSIVWIAGGLAKGADMEDLVKSKASRLKAVLLIGTDRELISDALTKHAPEIPKYLIDGDSSEELMEKLIIKGMELAVSGDVVLLAPACASMDQFTSYAHRGDLFAEKVKQLLGSKK